LIIATWRVYHNQLFPEHCENSPLLNKETRGKKFKPFAAELNLQSDKNASNLP